MAQSFTWPTTVTTSSVAARALGQHKLLSFLAGLVFLHCFKWCISAVSFCFAYAIGFVPHK